MMSTQRIINVAVIGATGSVGTSVLDICRAFPERFHVSAVAASSSAMRLLEIAREFGARRAYLKAPTQEVRDEFASYGIELLSDESLADLATDGINHAVFASSGTDAIHALAAALDSGIDVSLANKESIVAAGPWIMPRVKRDDQLRPVDSEHSAVWQCMRAEPHARVERVYLTASGGPFREWSAERLSAITPDEALKHPVWKMGPKITIDSATLMNKGIECVEAMRLFDLPSDQVSAVVHPRALIHGMAFFSDGTAKLLLSQPDMRLPAAAALAWPDRLPLLEHQPDKYSMPEPWEWGLEFFEPDTKRFPCLSIAIEAARMGTAYPPVMIGADQVAVGAFIDGRIPFTSIPEIIERTLEKFSGSEPRSIDDAIALIAEGERIASELCAAHRR